MYEYIETFAREYSLTEMQKALLFAREKHEGQLRKGPEGQREPYITHPLQMASHAIALGLREDNLLAAILLHDVCEDCGVEPEELPVNETVLEAVRLVTRVDGESKEKYYGQIRENRIATLVKLIDRCHNVSSMAGSFSVEKLKSYIEETRQYVLPLLKKAKDIYPEDSDILFLLKYHIVSVVDSIEATIQVFEREQSNA